MNSSVERLEITHVMSNLVSLSKCASVKNFTKFYYIFFCGLISFLSEILFI